MEEIKRHEEPAGQTYSQQPLGRILVPVNQDYEEEQKPKKRRRQNDTNRERRKLIVHIAILVLLLAIIIFGIIYFLSEGKQQEIP